MIAVEMHLKNVNGILTVTAPCDHFPKQDFEPSEL